MKGYPPMRLDLRDQLLELEAAGAVVTVHTTTAGVGVMAPGGNFPQTGGPLCRIERGGVGVAGLGDTVDQAIEDALGRWEARAHEAEAPRWTVTSGPELVSERGDDFFVYRWTLSRPRHQDVDVDVEITNTLIPATAEQWPGAARAIASQGRSEAEAVTWWRWPPRKSRFVAAHARKFRPYGCLERQGGEP